MAGAVTPGSCGRSERRGVAARLWWREEAGLPVSEGVALLPPALPPPALAPAAAPPLSGGAAGPAPAVVAAAPGELRRKSSTCACGRLCG